MRRRSRAAITSSPLPLAHRPASHARKILTAAATSPSATSIIARLTDEPLRLWILEPLALDGARGHHGQRARALGRVLFGRWQRWPEHPSAHHHWWRRRAG